MSINHIIDGSIPDNEKLDVYFNVVKCNEIECNNISKPLNPATTHPPSATPGVGNLNVFPTNCLKLDKSVIMGWTFFVTIPDPALAEFYIDAPYPDLLSQYYFANPDAVSAFNTIGYASIYTETTDIKGHQFTLLQSEPTPLNANKSIRLTFRSIGNVPATSGPFVLFGKVQHTTAPFV